MPEPQIPALPAHIPQRFDWDSPDGRWHITFDVTAILRAIDQGQLRRMKIITKLDREFARQWIATRDLNLDWVRSMPKAYPAQPVLGVQMDDQSILCIDGSHRYWRRYLDLKPDIRFHVVPWPDWHDYALIQNLRTGETNWKPGPRPEPIPVVPADGIEPRPGEHTAPVSAGSSGPNPNAAPVSPSISKD